MSKIHDTLAKKKYRNEITTIIHVVNTTDIPLKVEIFHDIDEFKVLIYNKEGEVDKNIESLKKRLQFYEEEYFKESNSIGRQNGYLVARELLGKIEAYQEIILELEGE